MAGQEVAPNAILPIDRRLQITLPTQIRLWLQLYALTDKSSVLFAKLYKFNFHRLLVGQDSEGSSFSLQPITGDEKG